MTVYIRQLQHDAYSNACEKGWHERPVKQDGVIDHDRVLAKLLLVHSEVSEAWDARNAHSVDDIRMRVINGKPEGFAVEIADAVIRMLDLCGALDIDLADYVDTSWPAVDPSTFVGYRDELHRARFLIDKAGEAVRVDDWPGFANALGEVMVKLALICKFARVDLVEAITVKMTYNKTRPHRHGGKKA